MNIANIDNISVNGKTKIHKSGAASKIIFAALLISGFLASSELNELIFLLIIILTLAVISKIPFKLALNLLMYPLFFSAFFAFLLIRESSLAGIFIMLKASGAAFTLIWLILTTPYIDVFSFLNKIFPSVIVDILFFTYRSFFILLEKLENIFKSIKLKGGYHLFDILSNLKNIAGIIGLLIIHSFEMSERMYKIYTLRGYDGKLPSSSLGFIEKKTDYILILLGIAALTGVIIPWNI